MIKIKIKLFGSLFIDSKITCKEYHKITVSSPVRVIDVINKLNISEKSVLLVLINNRKSSINSTLENKDIIKIYPFVAGG